MDMQKSNYISITHEVDLSDYVKDHIKKEFKNNYQDFVPLVSQRVEDLCKELFRRLETWANNHPDEFTVDLSIHDYYLDSDLVNLIKTLFRLKMRINNGDTVWTTKGWEEHSIGGRLFSEGGRHCVFTCFWTPKNEYFYPGNISLRYTYHPEAQSVHLLNCARKGIETDVNIISQTEEKIPVHALILKTNSEYFKRMLNKEMKELQDKAIPLPYSTEAINDLVQFIYVGKIGDASQKKLELLLELLEMSHQYLLSDLHNHCIDLIRRQLLNGQANFSLEVVVGLINSAYNYNLKAEFLELSLKAAERLLEKSNLSSSASSSQTSNRVDASSEESSKNEAVVVDWTDISKTYYTELLTLSTEYHLPCMQEKLSFLINKHLLNQ